MHTIPKRYLYVIIFVCTTLAMNSCSTLNKGAERLPSSETGNRVLLIENPDTALRVRWDLIELETKEIFVDFHLFDTTGVGGYSLAKICQKAQQGVRVRIIVDGIALALWGNQFIDGALLRLLNENCRYQDQPMISVKFWNPVEQYNLPTLVAGDNSSRNHDKILYLEDLQTVYEGDRNWQNVNFRQDPHQPGYTYVSTDAIVNGPAVNDVKPYLEEVWGLAESFEPKLVTKAEKTHTVRTGSGGSPTTTVTPLTRREYFQDTYETKKADFLQKLNEIKTNQVAFVGGEAYIATDWREKAIPVRTARFVHYDPTKRKMGDDESMTYMLNDLFASAQTKIFFATPFLKLPELYLSTIENRASNGVKITLMTSTPDTRMGTVLKFYQTQKADIDRLTKAGVKIYMNTGTDAFHVKTIMVDNQKMYLGTHNMNPRSVEVDLESGFIFDSPSLVQELEQFLMSQSQDYKSKTPISHYLLAPLAKPLLHLPFLRKQL